MNFSRSALILVVLILTGCDGGRQVRTYADLQGIVSLVVSKSSEQSISEEVVMESIRSVSEDGLDTWGNPYVVFIRGQHWVVLSTGSDGALDFEREAAYFELEPEDIRGEPHRDIVFRDGKNITYGGT